MATKPPGNLEKPRFGPSGRLIAMFRDCTRDPTEAINVILKRMLHTFLLHHRDNEANEETKELALKCCREAGFLYYRILEDLISQEKKRLGVTAVSGILEIDLFQCCLVACCLEITICSNRLPCDFPMLLQILKMAPYHFWRVIELVLRSEVRLPRDVVSHLSQVEEEILESLAWTSDSPLWEEIGANEGHLPACQQVTLPARLEDPKNTDVQPDPNRPGALFLPVEVGLGADLSASTDQQRCPSAVSRPQRSSLLLFSRKVYSQMSRHLSELCCPLGISDELRFKIWTCFEYSLVNCNKLMVGRHLDQLLLCAIYIIARITKVEIPFKFIMKCYKSQPRASKSVCKNVLISGGKMENSPIENNNNGDHSNSIPTPNTPSAHYQGSLQEQRGNLINFYNQVYTTKIEHFAKQFALTSGGDTPPLTPYPRQWKASPCRHLLSSNSSISISPYNPETASSRPPGLCYYFKSSPLECLREINNMIKTNGLQSRRCYEVSMEEEEREEEEEEEEDGPSAKRHCLDNQSAWQRRLRTVVNDRVTRRKQDQPSSVTKPNLY